jgi:CHAT domain-containing protein
VLEYFAADRDLLVWAVDENGARLFNLGPIEETLPLVESIHRSLSSSAALPEDAWVTLSNRLLPSKASHLWQSGLLHIAADADLRRLPFELLRIPGDANRMLIEAVSLSYLPSTSALGLKPDPVQNHQLEVAGFANPQLESDSGLPDSLRERLVRRFQLEPLPGAESELRSLEKWLPQPQRLLTGPEATEQAYRSAISYSPRIAHIATHSVIDDQLGLGTAIVLSPDGTDDGLLFPREIAQQNGAVGLSVLAACRTAADPGRNLDALDTLTGAFLAGGSSAVLATLWDVGDESAAIFLDQFYYRIGRGSSAADALRETKLAMMADVRWESPALWAGYVLVGDAQPITPSYWAVSTSTRFVVVAATLVVILVLGNYWRRRRD